MVGGVVWIIDMHMCTHLLSLYLSCSGATLHILSLAPHGWRWQTLVLMAARGAGCELGIPVELR